MTLKSARTPRIHSASLANRNLVIGPESWKRLEEILGRELKSEVRDQIQERTRDYVAIDSEGPRCDDVTERIVALLNAATKLRKVLRAFQGSDSADVFARTVVNGYLTYNHATSECDGLITSQDLLNNPIELAALVGRPCDAVIVACERALGQINDNPQDFDRGPSKHWNVWVCQIIDIFEAHDLPTSAPSDSDKRDKSSEFVAFLYEFPIPDRKKQHLQSQWALAQAIKRARASRYT
jgi:hypothetical protein